MGAIPISDASIPLATGMGALDLMLIDVVDGSTPTGYRTKRITAASLFGATVYSQAPAYTLASGALAVPLFMPLDATTETIPAGKTFSYIRGSNADGSVPTLTIGAGSVATGPYFVLSALLASDSTSNLYAGVFHARNGGPGTARGVHLGAYGLSGGTGFVSGAGIDLQPVATLAGAWGVFTSLNSTGVNGVAVGYGIESGNGDTYNLGFGSTIGPVGYVNAVYRAWMGTASSTNARAFQIYNNGGTELAYWDKAGNVIAPQVGGFAAAGAALILLSTSNASPSGDLITLRATSIFLQSAPSGGSTYATVNSSGINIQAGNLLSGGTQVVGTRKTGWTVATGTPSRATFTTSGVTLATLAGVVMALEQDLISHGLIGT